MKKSVTVLFLANVFSLMSGVVTSLLTAWALGAEGRGDLALVLLYPNIVALAVGLGLPQASRYFVARQPRKLSMLFSNAVCFTAVMGLLALLLAEFVVPQLVGTRSDVVMWLLKVYLINIPLALLYDLMSGLLEGSQKFKLIGAVRIGFFATQSVSYLILWLSGNLTVASASATMILAQLVVTSSALTAVCLSLRPAWRVSMRVFKRSASFGLRYHLGVVTSFTTLRLDQMMLAGIATSIEIGMYVVAVRISEVMTVLASSVSEVLLPEVAKTGGSAESMALLTKSLRQTICIYLVMLLPLVAAAPFLLYYGFGQDFMGAIPTLRILFVASLVWSMGAILNSGLNGTGNPGLSTISRLSSAVITVVSLLFWLPRYGILGAAMSSLAGYSAMFFVALFWLSRKGKVHVSDVFRLRVSDFHYGRIADTNSPNDCGISISTAEAPPALRTRAVSGAG
jgi:enterobacterial common antigen flippase